MVKRRAGLALTGVPQKFGHRGCAFGTDAASQEDRRDCPRQNLQIKAQRVAHKNFVSSADRGRLNRPSRDFTDRGEWPQDASP